MYKFFQRGEYLNWFWVVKDCREDVVNWDMLGVWFLKCRNKKIVGIRSSICEGGKVLGYIV